MGDFVSQASGEQVRGGEAIQPGQGLRGNRREVVLERGRGFSLDLFLVLRDQRGQSHIFVLLHATRRRKSCRASHVPGPKPAKPGWRRRVFAPFATTPRGAATNPRTFVGARPRLRRDEAARPLSALSEY